MMSLERTSATGAALLLFAAALLAGPAQDPEGPLPPPVPIGEVDPEAGREEMIELFRKVEQRLQEIDKLLFDASAGEAIGDEVEESGIAELLRQSTTKAEEVVEGIDRILEIAQQQGGAQQAMQSQGQPQGQSSGSPLDQQQGQQQPQGQKEQTPEGPGGQQEPQPEPEGQQPHDEPGSSGRPESPRDSDEQGQNEENQPPPTGESAGGTRTVDTSERWGDLPIHVRDLFRTEGGGDMPPQYRDWIDAYYRRLNQRP